MLTRFIVENHRSLRDQQALSLVTDRNHPNSLVAPPLGQPIVRIAGLFGANASGKSNVIDALLFMRAAVLQSQARWTPGEPPRDPYRLRREPLTRPSTFAVDFVQGGTAYQYGFVFEGQAVSSEWLHQWPDRRKQVLFERVGREFHFPSRNLKGQNRAIEKLTRTDSLFLSAAAQQGHEQLMPLFQWFAQTLKFADLANQEERRLFTLGQTAQNENFRRRVVALLQAADTGIVDLRTELHGPYNGDASTLDAGTLLHFNGMELSGDRLTSGPLQTSKLTYLHRGEEDIWLPHQDESEGTSSLFALAGPLIDALTHGRVLCVDELDACLHPLLMARVIDLFQNPTTNPKGAQLVFSGHGVSLLGTLGGAKAVLHRDEVWLCEKGAEGDTRLIRLADHEIRKDERLDRRYLQGRYGGIPVLGDLLEGSGAS